jgi:hypothetical protein
MADGGDGAIGEQAGGHGLPSTGINIARLTRSAASVLRL